MAEISLRIVGRDLPGAECGEFRNVHVGVQRGREPEGLVPGDAAEAVWEVTVGVVAGADGEVDFRGPCVHGRRGERFLYLTWGEMPPGGEFRMFRRAKLFLADLPQEVVERGRGVGELALAGGDGMGVCAGVRPPEVVWR